MRPGRFEVSTVGYDPNVQLIGGDPWGSLAYTGLIVPAVGTLAVAAANGLSQWQSRYLFLLARARFHNGEKVYLRGVRQYADLVGSTDGAGPFYFPIQTPLWRFPDANISWHVMLRTNGWRDVRNPANAPSVIYQSAKGPALLYQALAPYIPPNGGRPWGKPIASDLANWHDMRFPWRDSMIEHELCIPLPTPCEVALYASVGQHTTGEGGAPIFSATQAAAAAPEDRFWAGFLSVAYGRVAGSLIFGQEMNK